MSEEPTNEPTATTTATLLSSPLNTATTTATPTPPTLIAETTATALIAETTATAITTGTTEIATTTSTPTPTVIPQTAVTTATATAETTATATPLSTAGTTTDATTTAVEEEGEGQLPAIHLPGDEKFISYKNSLQCYCQKIHVGIPLYKAERESNGLVGTVTFNGTTLRCQQVSGSAKEADTRAAYDALVQVGYLQGVRFDMASNKRKRPPNVSSFIFLFIFVTVFNLRKFLNPLEISADQEFRN